MSSTPTDPSAVSAAAAEGEIVGLRAALRRHNHLYHVEARPEISDARYDEIYQRLKALEEAHPELVTPDSPTQRVGAPPRSELPTVQHAAPMLSLDSTQDEAEVRRFDERIRKALGALGASGALGMPDAPVEYLLEPKLDGASLEVVYEDGVLVRAVTRGNGIEGEGVTENVRTIPSVPLRLRDEERPVPDFLSVRGEVLMRLSDFEALNQRQVELGNEPYVNPRNTTAGALRQLDSSVTATRPLHFLAYDILAIRGGELARDRDVVSALRAWGLPTPERIEVVEGVEGILTYHAAFETDRDELDYEIDGVVAKLDDMAARDGLGMTSHHPRWALAVKFEPRKEVTRIDRIAVSVGRTGAITPVALLRPVEVGGVTVSRASLHNRDELERKDIREGDLVRVQRAGDVIPQVVERIEEEGRERAEPYEMPGSCPACGTPVVIRGPFTVCVNTFACPAQVKGRIVHLASRSALDIEGLGEETATLLVERGLVRTLPDLFDLTAEDLLPLPGFADRSATNLIAGIQARRRVDLSRLLFGLGIPEVGVTVARALARTFGELEALRGAEEDELQAVGGIGPKMSEQIHAFFHDPRNRAMLDGLRARGVDPLPVEGPRGEGLRGKTFLFTGGLERLSRPEAKVLVEDQGGRVTSSVSAKTDYLVAGENPGSKLAKARELGIPILSEAEFLTLLREQGESDS